MAKLKDNLQDVLDEARTLILGAQILLGFQYEAVYHEGFTKLPAISRYLDLVAIVLMVIAIILLMAPAPFHRIVERGNDSRRLHRYTTRLIGLALLPFAISFGIDIFIIFDWLQGPGVGIAAGALISATALFFWYGLELLARRRSGGDATMDRVLLDTAEPTERTSLGDKVRHVLTEARVVLPGAQALLGFQFIAMITDPFEELSRGSKYLHGVSLLAVALSTILLMAPAAYHRLAERGENTERFQRMAGRFILWAMLLLAIGISIDVYVVGGMVLGSTAGAAAIALALLLMFATLWFIFPLWCRRYRPKDGVYSGERNNDDRQRD